MKTKIMLLVMIALMLLAVPAFASLDQSVGTVAEGAVEFPVGLVKLVGGIVWTVGEVIILPFNLLF